MMDRLSEIRARCEAFEDSNDSYKGVRPQYILPVLADDGYPHNWAEIAAHSHEDIPYLLGLLEEAEVENRWIPVSDRMPKDPGWYQVFRKGHSHAEGGYFRGKTWSFGKHYGEVTHWRPLPEPPKGV